MYCGAVTATATHDELSAPTFLRLAGHPLRWDLLTELGRSDRTVQELTDLVGERQNLVSYHLGQLRSGGLVSARKSSADGRDTYYTADLTRLREMVAGTGTALHPGLVLVPPAPVPRTAETVRLLFLCTGNSARSQMAEALVRSLADGSVDASSAGSHPKALHPEAVRVMRDRGIDIAGQRPKHLDELAGEHFDRVVTLCDRVREVCPDFPGHPDAIHWSVPDPAVAAEDGDSSPAFQRTADELETRIGFLLAGLDRSTPTRATGAPTNPGGTR